LAEGRSINPENLEFNMTLERLKSCNSEVRLMRGSAQGLELARVWEGGVMRSRLVNRGNRPVTVREIVLLAGPLPVSAEARLYGEGFQKLSQTGGTVAAPVDLGGHTDRGHWRLPQAADAVTVYNMAMLGEGGEWLLMGFASCRRFAGALRFWRDRFEVVLDTEGLELGAGEAWPLEELLAASGGDREVLLERLATQMAANHPRLKFPEVPAGWCSWYWYGPGVTEANVLENLDFIVAAGLPLKYVQIDDGYQPWMGDWLEANPRFPSGVKALCGRIREKGFEPAIWVAPFIASPESKLFGEHPEWFVKDEEGRPLRSDRVTFGGWRLGPWYALDGTHPEAQGYLEHVFRTMRREWGCTYFKLDANAWGAMHGGRFSDGRATRVEAYRRGMAAVRRGAGDGLILGCNAPMWPSVGEVHAMRLSNDVGRRWDRMSPAAREMFHRNWQNGRLWINDPDCIVLANKPNEKVGLTDEEFLFHATAVYATGGMVLAGDKMDEIPPERLEMLRKLLPPTGVAARFESDEFRIGVIELGGGRRDVCVLNWTEEAADFEVELRGRMRVTDFWTGEDMGVHEGRLAVRGVAGHGARLLTCRRA
jgi:alpha-galactosidase